MQAEEDAEFVGARVEAGLRAARFSSPPSSEEFAASIEPKNVPAVFRGVLKGSAASPRWDPLHGGLDYLLEKVGPDVAVEAMMSSTGHVFYGDLRSHERVSIPFSTFMHSCKSYLGHLNAASDSSKDKGIGEEPTCSGEMCSAGLEISEQLYLAQVSILNTENKERCSLEVLKEDIQEPIFLKGKPFSSINFWMSRAHMRSSTHYDPHHNLLCVVAGCKKVTLWSPSASPFLYPMPVYGEASNHSGVSIEEPDYSSYTRAKYMKEYSERVVLNCGDALFIPEGWYHQVDSDDLTIAINFWWKSRIMTEMLEHMDAYYLRRILRRLVDTEMNKIVQKNFFRHAKENNGFQPTDKELRGSEQFNLHNEVKSHDTSDKKGARDTSDKKGAADTSGKKGAPLQSLEPSTLQALYELMSMVHDSVEAVDQNDIAESASQDTSSSQSNERKKTAADDSSLLEKDPVAKIILPVEPLELRSMLLAMVHTFPRTLEGLVLNILGPTGAEILTRKFDEMDQQTTTEEQTEFYKTFYSAFDDQYAAMDTLLNRKELFSFQVFQSVLDQYLRVHVDRPS
ncbi:hypothetical protein CFC21_036515 [Triticum aestivum]|uniref:JmjC domain-containing protein n=3 Tax=Triticum TaxID=4564 RepID=A0A9R0RR82_TRITD|nr:uncharacterized protein LOC123062210 [Triticum aestivum]KAF7024117.1 hypothetical protein CFC21_036515 [Triticum aestivum]VAH64584.1 unnamed protein product [Triticum turgidum subsp. durum]